MCVHAKKVGILGMIVFWFIEMECVYKQKKVGVLGMIAL